MPQVAVEKIDGKKPIASSVMDELKALTDRIRERAFEIFEGRGNQHGLALNDWLKAEQDLFWFPQSELVEADGKFKLQVNAPGFDHGDIQVTALPDALFVKASSTHKHDGKEGDVRFCEFDGKALFRRFDLPEPIDVDKVTANLEKGVLHVTALKAKKEEPAAPKVHSLAA